MDFALIVEAARENPDLIRQHLVNQAMLLASTPRPRAGEFVPQRLRPIKARERIPVDTPYKADYPQRLNAVLFDPPGQILKRGGIEFQRSHIPRVSTTASSERPARRRAAARRRCFMVSELSKYPVSRSD
jgi:hypothetical protein